jgi:hypothetical protein
VVVTPEVEWLRLCDPAGLFQESRNQHCDVPMDGDPALADHCVKPENDTSWNVKVGSRG